MLYIIKHSLLYSAYGSFSCENTEQQYVEYAPLDSSCRDLQYHSFDQFDVKIAGCACRKDDQYLDAYGRCVRKEECTCVDDYYGEVAEAGDISRRGCADWYA